MNFVSNLLVVVADPVLLNGSVTESLAASLLETALFVVSRIVVVGLVIAAFIFAAKGLVETRDGSHSGRGTAIAAIVVGSLVAIGVLVTLVSFAVQFIQAFLSS